MANRFCATLFVVISLCSCGKSPQERALDRALELAGENRAELERVLEHYSLDEADSLKLRAAKFLIANMPGHGAMYGEAMDEWISGVEGLKIPKHYLIRRSLYSSVYKFQSYIRDCDYRQDIHVITADYLIRNIDKAFELREKRGWTSLAGFDDFCEYLLPYRTDREPLDNWKDSMFFSQDKLDYLDFFDIKYDLVAIIDHIYTTYFRGNRYGDVKVLDPMGKEYKSDCHELARAVVAVCRVEGIPATIDNFIAWPDRDLTHASAVAIDWRFTASRADYEKSQVTKVLRNTFSSHDNIPMAKDEYIPPVFRNTRQIDVTEEYAKVTDIEIKIPRGEGRKAKYVYLATFGRDGWQPTWWAKVRGSSAVFEKMGQFAVYMPICYKGMEPVGLDYPFYMTKEGARKLVPDLSKRITIVLDRKCPVIYKIKWYWAQGLYGSHIEAADNPDFRDAKRFDTLTHNPNMSPYTLTADKSEKYRYWRYVALHPDAYIADLKIKDTKGAVVPHESITIINERPGYDAGRMFDDDPLTFYTCDKGWVGFDFGEPIALSSFEFLPRNDGNNVEAGNEYELFYRGENEWVSLGRQTATSDTIIFENVPAGALYWLHNHTNGVEERTFTYENGIVKFW